MNPYIQKLTDHLTESAFNNTDVDVHTILDLLFSVYQDLYPTDPEYIQASFSHLNDILSKLPLRECDKVWDLTCQLCIDHARFAFRAGVQIGAKLMEELSE